MPWRRTLLFLFYVFIFALLWRNSFAYLDPDLGWHLRVGAEIARSGAVPDLNLYNYAFTGSWVDHEWLGNLLSYEIYSRFGYPALSAVFAGLALLALLILNREARRRLPSVPDGLILVLGTIGLMASLPHLGLRLQEVGLLFSALLLSVLGRYDDKPDWRLFIILPPFFYLWASLHASFLIGLGLLAVWFALRTAEKFSARRFFATLSVLAFSLGATLLTPYQLRLYSFLSGYRDGFYRTHLEEWLSQFSFPLTYWQLGYLAFVVLTLFLYIYHARGRRKIWALDSWTVFLAVFFVFLSFQSRRHFPLMFAATFPFLAAVHGGLWPSSAHERGERSPYPWLRAYLAACLILVALFQFTQAEVTVEPFRAYCEDYPCGARDFLAEHPEYDGLRLFNHYAWGGYLIWTLPSRPLFIDGRLPQVALAGHTYLEEYYEFFRSEKAADKLREYDIGLVILPVRDEDIKARDWEKFLFQIRDEELKGVNRLRDYLATAPGWTEIYRDESSVLYRRQDQAMPL